MGSDCQVQTGGIDIEVQTGQRAMFLVLVSGTEPIFLLLRPTLHSYAYNLQTDKKSLADMFCLEKVQIAALLVPVRQGYLLHR